MSPEQREVEQEEGSEGREEGQDSPIACGDDIHLYDNQISPGPGQYAGRETARAAGGGVCDGDREGGGRKRCEEGQLLTRKGGFCL